MSAHTYKGTVTPYLLSEFCPLPGRSNQFDLKHYRSAGQSWPIQEFEGIFQMYRHARLCRTLERPLATGDILILQYTSLNLISTMVVLDRTAPLLWNGEAHRIFEGDPEERVLLQLPRSLRPDLVEIQHQ